MKLNIYEEASRCLLCQDAPCTKACATGDPARAIRAIRFDNHKPALRRLSPLPSGLPHGRHRRDQANQQEIRIIQIR